MHKILIIDDDKSTIETLEFNLSKEGYRVCVANNGNDGIEKFIQEVPDLVILDISLPDIDGFAVLEYLQEESEAVKVIMMTAFHDMETTIRAMKEGAFDYIHKPINIDELNVAIQKALTSADMEKKTNCLPIKPMRQFKVGEIIGSNRDMLEIFKTIGIVSQSKATVLIQGESGTGKELVAKVIHNNTDIKAPFIAINCSAIVETLLESELFGHEKGAFTGAIGKKLGKFELAGQGTVFLDEISEMSAGLQSKLLRVLQEHEFERVGGKDSIKVKARIIAATNKDLRAMVRDGKFREDLFYRLNIVSIRIPPLRNRINDIPLLVEYLLDKINHQLHKNIVRVSDDVLEYFLSYSWPGNVRELENLLVRVAVVAKSNTLTKSDFPKLSLATNITESSAETIEKTLSVVGKDGMLLTLDDMEKRYIALVISCGAKTKGEVCDLLGISRPTLERKLEKYGIAFEKE
ncbi:MAG: sigma-54 dependent transcriptional regulator [Deltaproteobacteria bacterium]